MKFYYDKEKSLELMEKIEKEFGVRSRKTARGEEMHVTDLTGCLVKPYCRLVGIERRMTKQIVGVMVFGIIAETILGWTYPKDQLQYQSNLWMLEFHENIFGHIDIYEELEKPLEVKASRKRVFKASEVPNYWVEQLMSYMAIQAATLGWLILFNVFSTQIMAFRMELTMEDILGWLIVLNDRATAVRTSAKARNPFSLKINPKEYEYCFYKHDCPRKGECREAWKKLQDEKKQLKKAKTKKAPLD